MIENIKDLNLTYNVLQFDVTKKPSCIIKYICPYFFKMKLKKVHCKSKMYISRTTRIIKLEW